MRTARRRAAEHRRCRRCSKPWEIPLDWARSSYLRLRDVDDPARQARGVGRRRLGVETGAGNQQCKQSCGRALCRICQRLAEKRSSYGDPETGKKGDCEIQRQIRCHGFGRLAGGVDHRDIGAVHAGGEAGFLGFFKHPHVEIVTGIRFLTHGGSTPWWPRSAFMPSLVACSRLLRTSCSRSRAVCQLLRKRSTSFASSACFCRSRSCS